MKYVVDILFMTKVTCVSHYFYGCEPQYVIDISMKLYAIHVISEDFLKLWKKGTMEVWLHHTSIVQFF